ncbi:MAG: hypothetical protein IPJ27_00025 [Candidatus Accumulibacter sp.]|uniref:Uncharacterized protein n=1 Tax=Candidatus Accumulibacter proximus TaxID=2954385 RepID=A0A935PWH3_9PROT|nr:hypothetical protein [Candidatus Accumulibacter proximus]
MTNGAPTIGGRHGADGTRCHYHNSGAIGRATHGDTRNTEEFRDLATSDDQPNTGEITADDGKRDVPMRLPMPPKPRSS